MSFLERLPERATLGEYWSQITDVQAGGLDVNDALVPVRKPERFFAWAEDKKTEAFKEVAEIADSLISRGRVAGEHLPPQSSTFRLVETEGSYWIVWRTPGCPRDYARIRILQFFPTGEELEEEKKEELAQAVAVLHRYGLRVAKKDY